MKHVEPMAARVTRVWIQVLVLVDDNWLGIECGGIACGVDEYGARISTSPVYNYESLTLARFTPNSTLSFEPSTLHPKNQRLAPFIFIYFLLDLLS